MPVDTYSMALAERDAALAEVARLSTPPDDAEVAALVKRLSGTPLYEGHGEASDAPDEAADALTRLSRALAAETAKRVAKEAEIIFLRNVLSWDKKTRDIADRLSATIAKHWSK